MVGRVALIIVAAILVAAVEAPVFAQALSKIRVANIGGTSDHIQIAIQAGIYTRLRQGGPF
jgi:hypothetical protein